MKSTPLGSVFENENYLCFFGNKTANLDTLKRAYPNLEFWQIHQIHSDICVEASADAAQKADAHWTSTPEKALLIKTADCIPVLIAAQNPRLVFSIHSGWRGVASKIVSKSLSLLFSKGCERKTLQIFTGPCIQYSSFEVRDDALPKILSSVQKTPVDSFREISPGQYKVDLLKILQQQILEAGLRTDQLMSSAEDTLTNEDFFSYRRDPQSPGRQLSFIALKPPKSGTVA